MFDRCFDGLSLMMYPVMNILSIIPSASALQAIHRTSFLRSPVIHPLWQGNILSECLESLAVRLHHSDGDSACLAGLHVLYGTGFAGVRTADDFACVAISYWSCRM